MRRRPGINLPSIVAMVMIGALPALLRMPRRRPRSYGRELEAYRRDLTDRTTLIDNQLATLVELFPGPWIHWGGDEVFRSPWMSNAQSLAWMKPSEVFGRVVASTA